MDEDDYQARQHALKAIRYSLKGMPGLVAGDYMVSHDYGVEANGDILLAYNKEVVFTMSAHDAFYDADRELAEELQDRRRKASLEKKLELVEQYGEDTFANGTIFGFDKKFTEEGKVYTYAALKTDNTWYVTGERGLFGFTKGSWDELVLGLVGGKFSVSAEEVAIYEVENPTPLLDSDATFSDGDRNESTDF